MTTIEKKIDALMRYVTATTPDDRRSVSAELLALMDTPPEAFDLEGAVRNLLLKLGSPDHLVGHPYTVQAIKLVVEDRTYIDNITFLLYPTLAEMFDTTASRVERAIRHLIEVTWTRGDYEILNHYFGNTVSADKGKPTNGEFLARCANIIHVKQRHAS